MGTYSKFISRTQIGDNLYEIKHGIYHNGSCTCFKDCDCYSKKGGHLGDSIRYSNGIVFWETGRERTYQSIEGCMSSLKAYLDKRKNQD